MTLGERIAHWRWLWIPVAFMISDPTPAGRPER